MSKEKNDSMKEMKTKKPLPLFGRLFPGKKHVSLLEEEQIQSPLATIIKTFRSNKVGMAGLLIFFTILAIVTIGPWFYPVDLGYEESTQTNIAPGMDLMEIPAELEGNVKQVSVGPTFSIGLSNDGEVYAWGKTRVSNTIDIKNDIPENMGKVVQIAAGFDHAVALNDEGKIFTWGSARQKQAGLPPEVEALDNVAKVFAGYQATIILTEDGYTHYFGNTRTNDYFDFHEYQGQIQDIMGTASNYAGLTFDGQVVFLGTENNPFSRIPENMGTVVDIGATTATMAAVNDAGEIFIWGNVSDFRGEGNVPEITGKVVDIEGGHYHYTALTEDGDIYAWGQNNLKQSKVPNSANNIESIFVGYFQNYGLKADGSVETWGLKGYLMGTDELGRDVFNRLLNGGRMTMTIGGVAVIISTIIGVIVGGISGYFGGKIDMFLQRVAEMVASLPFLPFAMILTSLIGNKLTNNERIFMIMVILGVLSWPGLMRLVRAQVFSVREQEYVTAARIIGVNQFAIVFRHIIPNVISVILVSVTLSFSASMITESSLSFLGFGVQAPQPTWGNMLTAARNSIVIQNYWWRWVFASVLLSVCVISVNLVGESLRDAIDPKSQER